MDPNTQTILSRIKAYCSAHDMAETTFGIRAANDGKLVSRLKGGRTITLRTLDAIQRQLALPPGESARDDARGAA